MKNSILILVLTLCGTTFSQNSAIRNAEKNLTNEYEKTWVYLETISTMGNRQTKSNDCIGDTLRFKLVGKIYLGLICESKETNNNLWSIEGEDEDELYINLDQRYMIDIYTKVIDGNRVEVLRLKKISKVKDEPSVGHLYITLNE